MTTRTELSRIDQTILRYASSRSPEEISALLGGVITPERVAEQAKKLLNSRSWLTAAEEDELVLNKLHDILTRLESNSENHLDNESALTQMRLLKEVGTRLDKRREATQIDLNSYHLNVGRAMANAYNVALGYMRGALREQIDEATWDTLALEAITHAKAVIAEKAVDDDGQPVRSLDAT